ncbi:hypothetical protein GCM10009533_71100 [Saccharopolyspora spinosporotrichia]|uniref:Uncharacterized protein n=1 Tax=Saccharopolyspora erythraea TaxID=1836 RepID=A0ABP3PCV2_SACER
MIGDADPDCVAGPRLDPLVVLGVLETLRDVDHVLPLSKIAGTGIRSVPIFAPAHEPFAVDHPKR